jgi:Niemann-Pick C1 protein
VFGHIGKFNYRHREIVVIASITFTLVCAVGLLSLKMETSPQNLWVSPSSLGYEQEMNFNDQYGAFFRTEQIILAQNDLKENNIFDHDHLYSLYFLLSLINKKKIMYNEREIGI